MQKILIADNSPDFCGTLAEVLIPSYNILTCADGQTAKELLSRIKPDVMIFDAMIPGFDVLSDFCSAMEESFRPALLATSRYFNDPLLERMAAMGVSHAMVKPCDMDMLVAKVNELSGRPQPRNITQIKQAIVTKHIARLGLSPQHDGYKFLTIGVPHYAENTSQRLEKELYAWICDQTGHEDTRQIERSIRKAVEAAWENLDEDIWREYFPVGKDGTIKRPPNHKFLLRMAQILTEELNQENNEVTG